MITPKEIAIALVNGAILWAVFVLLAFAIRRYTRQLLVIILLVSALFYVVFTLQAREPLFWPVVEVAGVGIYGDLGLLGLRGSPWWLVAGWTLHPFWDVGLHYLGPGRTHHPFLVLNC